MAVRPHSLSRAFLGSNVGRGDPTPPGKLPIAAKLHGTVKTVPYKQPEGKQL